MSKCKNVDIMNTYAFPNYDVLYCDPPWEQRMVRLFQTMLKKDTGLEVDNDINAILKHLADLADVKKPAYVEYSIKGAERVIYHFQDKGHKLNQVIYGVQGNGKPYVIMSFNTDTKLPDGLIGFDIVKKVMELELPETVFDPFAGIGLTAKAVTSCGVNYIGHELNPARYERLKKVIENHNRTNENI